MFALAYHPPSNTLYGIGDNAGGYGLFTLNVTTGAATLVGATIYTNGLTWDAPRNRMLALNSSGQVFVIDLATGGTVQITGTVITNNNSFTYDPFIDRIWAANYNGEIARYDPGNSMASTPVLASQGIHTCIVYGP
jgi:hypothetical protein